MQVLKFPAHQIIVPISRRVNKLDIKGLGNDIVIALDSTGIKVANRGERIGTNGMLERKQVSRQCF